MRNKWHSFHTEHSPIKIDKPNTGRNNLLADWQRLAYSPHGDDTYKDNAHINGKPLRHFADSYNNFKTESDIKQFFKETILKNMVATDAKKDEVVDYLMTSFHQGGLMYPVGSAIGETMQDESGSKYALVADPEREIDIISTPNGFKVQEYFTVDKLNVLSKDLKKYTKEFTESELPLDQFDKEGWGATLTPESGKDHIIQAQGTIDVNFSPSGDAKDPSITIESNTINYGHSAVQAKLDQRSLGQRIVDFFKNILGMNRVQTISPESTTNEVDDEQETRPLNFR